MYNEFRKRKISTMKVLFKSFNCKIKCIKQEKGLTDYGHKNVLYIQNQNLLAKNLLKLIQPNDLIICLGAGSITKIANSLEEKLKNEDKHI